MVKFVCPREQQHNQRLHQGCFHRRESPARRKCCRRYIGNTEPLIQERPVYAEMGERQGSGAHLCGLYFSGLARCSGIELIDSQAVYQSLLHLSWIDKLLDNIRIIFVDLYGDQLKKPHTSVVKCEFDGYFDQQVRELESAAEKSPQRVRQIASREVTQFSNPENGHGGPPPPLPGLAPGELASESKEEGERLIPRS